MPPAKARVLAEDSRSDASTIRERQIAAAAHARKSKQQIGLNGGGVAHGKEHGHAGALKELAAASAAADQEAPGVRWN